MGKSPLNIEELNHRINLLTALQAKIALFAVAEGKTIEEALDRAETY